MNDVIVRSTEETHFLRDNGALLGALNRPINHFHYNQMDRVDELAAHLVLAIGKAHAFEQGNKRTAWAAGRLFIHNNGYALELDEGTQRIVAVVVEEMMSNEAHIKHLVYFLGENITVR
ncbi:type II toxin-antitoxin system death-on-curing family toxin [Rhizobium leguminosarum]|nr:type II toxin-antitoxin system death-on-curing family toxin [Rhizobium leguminosarum]